MEYPSTGNCSEAYSTAQAHSPAPGALAVTSLAPGTVTAYCALPATSGLPAVAGTTSVGIQGSFRAAAWARSCSMAVVWYTSGGAYVSTSTGPTVTDTTSGWTPAAYTVTAPATAAFALPAVVVASTGAASEVHYAADVNLYASATSPSQCNVISFGWDYRIALWESLYTALERGQARQASTSTPTRPP